ncbi:MAG: hypothetical protein K0T99_00535 [Alphaproteobacteria bacterium]|nr:hypothetical protein [Alphaproteobacteria bacterium]
MVRVIDYDSLVDELRWNMIKKALRHIKNDQIPGDHYFYISFLTSDPEVKLSRRLLERYPEEMTIVIQYQFKHFEAKNLSFKVTLQFDGIDEELEIPYSSITSFADPSVKFGLNFRDKKDNKIHSKKKTKPKVTTIQESDNVVVLDKFRKK